MIPAGIDSEVNAPEIDFSEKIKEQKAAVRKIPDLIEFDSFEKLLKDGVKQLERTQLPITSSGDNSARPIRDRASMKEIPNKRPVKPTPEPKV
jgi:hypothetical protein